MEPHWTLRWQPPVGLSFSLLASATQDYAVILGIKYCTTWRLSHGDPKEVHGHYVVQFDDLLDANLPIGQSKSEPDCTAAVEEQGRINEYM